MDAPVSDLAYGPADDTVKTGNFEGPVSVLLKLVVASEVDLYEIALSDIVGAFCAHIDELGETELDQVTEFLVPLSILVELKSRRLLPSTTKYDLAAEMAIYEERDLSLARLIEGHTFSAAARRLRRLVTEAARHYPRQAGPDERFTAGAPDPLEGAGPADIAAALRSALTRPPRPSLDIAHIAVPPVTVEQCAHALLKRLPDCGYISFRDLTGQFDQRVIVVAHFLALLELFRLGYIELTQSERFGDIAIFWVGGTDEIDFVEFDVMSSTPLSSPGSTERMARSQSGFAA